MGHMLHAGAGPFICHASILLSPTGPARVSNNYCNKSFGVYGKNLARTGHTGGHLPNLGTLRHLDGGGAVFALFGLTAFQRLPHTFAGII
jgi:hypothetical protein